MQDARAPVLVVGAGPVGLTAASVLVSRGVPVTVLEAFPEPQTDWRASTFHAATLELLSEIDITDEMHARGLVVPRYQYRDRRDGVVAEFDFGRLADVTRFPYRLQLNQQRLVVMLQRRLVRHPLAELRFGCRVVRVEQDGSGVTATVVGDGDGASTRVRGDFLLGADGSASTVRRELGVAFDGMTYPERFLIVSTSVELDACIPGLTHVAYCADPDEWVFLLHTPESWRMLFPIPPEEETARATSAGRMQERMQGVYRRAEDYDILDHQIYNVHQRVAATFRVGRVMLLGDAGHINSPLGGMGLNSGIHDAMDASARLARIYAGGADVEAELDMYAQRRRAVALDYVRADTHRNTSMMRERDPAVRAANHARLAATAADPQRCREWLMRASMLAPVADQGIGEPPASARLAPTPEGGPPPPG